MESIVSNEEMISNEEKPNIDLKSLNEDELCALLQSDLSTSNVKISEIVDEMKLMLNQKKNDAVEEFYQETILGMCEPKTIFYHIEPVLSACMIGTLGYYSSKYIFNFVPFQFGCALISGFAWNYYSIQSWKNNKKQLNSTFMENLNALFEAQKLMQNFSNITENL